VPRKYAEVFELGTSRNAKTHSTEKLHACIDQAIEGPYQPLGVKNQCINHYHKKMYHDRLPAPNDIALIQYHHSLYIWST